MHRAFYLGLILLLLPACRKPAESVVSDGPTVLPRVQTITIKPQVWSQTIRTFGVMEAAEKVTLSAEFSAKVDQVNFVEGQEIKAGHKMVVFDKAEQRMLARQAESNIRSAKVKLEEARSLAKRREELFAKKAINQEQLDIFLTTVANSEAKYAQAVVGGSLARHNLKRTSVVSPVSGRVVSKSVEVGEVAMPGQPLAVIHVNATIGVLTHVTEQEINGIQVGSECTLTTPGVRGRTYTAHVESRGGEVDPVTGNFPVKLTVDNSDGLLKPGMTAIIVLKGLEVGDAILVPDTSIVDRNRKRVVYRLKEGKAEVVEPVLAATVDPLVPVLHGLSVGDELIVSGLSGVIDGSQVKVIKAADLGESAEPVQPSPATAGEPSNSSTETNGSTN